MGTSKTPSLTQDLGPDELERLLSVMDEASFEKSECIVREGDDGDSMFLLQSGNAGVYKRAGTRDWVREELIALLEPGQCFGEMAVIESETRSATVRARSSCKLRCLSASGLAKLRELDADTYATVVLNIAKTLASRLRVANMAMKEFSLGEMRAILARHHQ